MPGLIEGSKLFNFLVKFTKKDDGILTRKELLEDYFNQFFKKPVEKNSWQWEHTQLKVGDLYSEARQKGFIITVRPGVYQITDVAIKAIEDALNKGVSVGFDWRK